MTVTLTPNIETRLRQKAARTGQAADTLAELLLSNALLGEGPSEELRAEYHQLAVSEMRGTLSAGVAARLAEVTRDMDALDMSSPAAQAMFERLTETDQKLDEMLAILRGLPLAETAQ